VIGYKISSFFLILVLLLSVTNLPTFSTTQLNSDSDNLNGLSIGLIGVAFADDDDENEDDEDDNGKDKKEKKEKKNGKQKIKVEIKDGETKAEIKINGIKSELDLDTNDLDEILTLIQTITGLSESEIKDIWEIEIKENGDDGDHGKKDKITICHIPPGNPDNAHTISVSGNAKNAHSAHGDTMGECPIINDDDNQDDDGQDNPTTITLTKQVTNDNQGTAVAGDFEISVNGTIVLSGSTTEVAPGELFAINEAAVDGYEFVEITGDDECPMNLDETISLESGQDINCIIHNGDVGQAQSSSFQTSESTSIDTTADNDDLSQLVEENKKLREDLERQGEQIDDLNEQVDYLSEIIASIQSFFGSIFG